MAQVKTTLVIIIGAMLVATLASCPPDSLDRDRGTRDIRKGDATVDARDILVKHSTTS